MSGVKGKSGPKISQRALDYLAIVEAGATLQETADSFQVSRQVVSKCLQTLADHGYFVPLLSPGRKKLPTGDDDFI